MSWLEVSLALTGELAEPVAELLGRHADGGVVLEEIPDPTHAVPQVTVRAYLTHDERLAERRQAIEHGLWHLSQISPLPNPEYRDIAQRDWNELWRARYQPMTVGDTLLVLPAWVEPPADKRRLIILEPGMAFGTGAHPSTRLCLLALEEFCEDGDTVLDLGCGSGILSIAAVRCGAGRVFGLDIDPHAVDNARRNLELNQLSGQVLFSQGSIQEAGELIPPGEVTLLLANILAPILIDLLDQGMADLLTEGGVLILSGILEDQLDWVLEKAVEKGLRLLKTYTEVDWKAIALTKA